MHSIWNSIIDMTNSLIQKSNMDLDFDINDPMYKNKNSLIVINNILNYLAIKSIDYQNRIIRALKIDVISPDNLKLISWDDFIRLYLIFD